MGRYAQAKRRGGSGPSGTLNVNLLIAHKTAADTIECTFDRTCNTLVGNVTADLKIKCNGFAVAFITFLSSTQLRFQFAGSVSIGFPIVVTGTPYWMTTPINPITLGLT